MMTFLFRCANATDAGEIEYVAGSDFYVDDAIYTVVSVEPAVPPPPRSRCRCCGRRAPASPVAQPEVWEAEVERTEGKFQSRDDVWAELKENLGFAVEEIDRPDDSEPCALCGRLAPPLPSVSSVTCSDD
jgi:hypothetical protein